MHVFRRSVGGLVVILGLSLDPWFESGGGAVVTGGLVTNKIYLYIKQSFVSVKGHAS